MVLVGKVLIVVMVIWDGNRKHRYTCFCESKESPRKIEPTEKVIKLMAFLLY